MIALRANIVLIYALLSCKKAWSAVFLVLFESAAHLRRANDHEALTGHIAELVVSPYDSDSLNRAYSEIQRSDMRYQVRIPV
jgi:hypothetical protein